MKICVDMEISEAEYLKFILQFVADFEGDYVFEGDVVDKPDPLLLINYLRAKTLLKKYNIW